MKYLEIYKEWKDNPIKFWKKNAEDVSWIKFPEKILTKKSENFYEWFSDGIMNTCYNAVDNNILQGRGDQVAIYYDSPITNSKSKLTYNELKSKVEKFAGALKKYNISKGDRVIVYMPMIPEAIISVLALSLIHI